MNKKEFYRRRRALIESCGESTITFVSAASIQQRTETSQFPFRQNNDFWYLTGFPEADAIAVIAPNRAKGEFILFNQPKDPDIESWDGPRIGQEGACHDFGADQAFSIDDFVDELPDLLLGYDRVCCAMEEDSPLLAELCEHIKKLRHYSRKGVQVPEEWIDLEKVISPLRLIKSAEEIKLMRKAAVISADAHTKTMALCKPGMKEYQLQAELECEVKKQGCQDTAYSSIVAAGKNACVLHYVANNDELKDGDLILIDAGGEYDHYAADITRTFPINGKFTEPQRLIYQAVLNVQKKVIKCIKPGVNYQKIQDLAKEGITEELLKLGLLKGKLPKLLQEQAYLDFYWHNIGHWLGLEVHDVGAYKTKDKWQKLVPGMVLTVEPGIYIRDTIKGVHKKWHHIGVRIEDDILVTETGHEVLSKGVVKEVGEIEALMKKNA